MCQHKKKEKTLADKLVIYVRLPCGMVSAAICQHIVMLQVSAAADHSTRGLQSCCYASADLLV